MENNDLQQLVRRMHRHHTERVKIFRELDSFTRSVAINQLSKKSQRELLSQLTVEEIVTFLNHLDPDKATDLIRLLPTQRQQAILSKLDERISNAVSTLLPFDPQTAAGMMNLNYVQIEEDTPVADIAKLLEVHEKRTGRIPTVVIVKEGKVTGYIPGSRLSLAHPEESAAKHKRHITTVNQSSSTKEVINIFKQHPHDKVVVLGDENNVLGIIYSDDVLRVLHEQSSASLYNFAGLHDEEDVNDTAKSKVKHRYLWLMLNLATAFLAAGTVGLFQDTINKYVLLAVYMPIVAGMGGNAGTQTLAVLVRGITLGHVRLRTSWHALKNEVLASAVNGLINGVIVAAVVLLFNRDEKLALVLGLAMIINLLVAAFFGTMVPLVMKALGKDPATSATIFITTATDVLGFIAFLGLATLILA